MKKTLIATSLALALMAALPAFAATSGPNTGSTDASSTPGTSTHLQQCKADALAIRNQAIRDAATAHTTDVVKIVADRKAAYATASTTFIAARSSAKSAYAAAVTAAGSITDKTARAAAIAKARTDETAAIASAKTTLYAARAAARVAYRTAADAAAAARHTKVANAQTAYHVTAAACKK